MRTVMLAIALLIPTAAFARHAPAPAVVTLDAPEALATLAATATVVGGFETQRVWTLTEAQYRSTALRLELDVQFGPTEEQRRDDATVAVWSEYDPTHGSEMRRRHLSRIVVAREAGTVSVVVTARRPTPVMVVASAN